MYRREFTAVGRNETLNPPIYYLFDLDGTITKEELLPRIATLNGTHEAMKISTRLATQREFYSSNSLAERIEKLSKIEISKVQDIVETVPVLTGLMSFIQKKSETTFIVTCNLDIWLQKFFKKYSLKGFTSQASICKDRVVLDSILDKKSVLEKFQGKNTVYVGDGSNDVQIMASANIGILSEIVHESPDSLWAVADFAVRDEESLCKILERL